MSESLAAQGVTMTREDPASLDEALVRLRELERVCAIAAESVRRAERELANAQHVARALDRDAEEQRARAERAEAEVTRLRELLAEPSEEEVARLADVALSAWFETAGLGVGEPEANVVRAILADLRARAGGTNAE